MQSGSSWKIAVGNIQIKRLRLWKWIFSILTLRIFSIVYFAWLPDFFSHSSGQGKCSTSPTLSLLALDKVAVYWTYLWKYHSGFFMQSYSNMHFFLMVFGLTEISPLLPPPLPLPHLQLQSRAIWTPSLWAPTFDEYALYCCSLPESARSKSDFATGLFHIPKSSWAKEGSQKFCIWKLFFTRWTSSAELISS